LPKPRLARSLEFPLLAFCWVVAAGNLRARQNEALPVMPLPAHVVRGEGEFVIDGHFGIALKGYKEPRLEGARQRFLDRLSEETGIPLWREASLNEPHFIVQTAGPSAPIQELGEDESYHLEITNTDVQLKGFIFAQFLDGRAEPTWGASRPPDVPSIGENYSESLHCSRRDD